MSLLSASSLARARQCPPSHALPAVRSDSTYAARGRVIHAYLAALVDGTPREEALAAVADPALREWCEKIDTRHVPRGAESEVAFAFDVLSGLARRLQPGDHRNYSVAPHEIPGTCDLVLWSDSAVEVWDWKTTSFDHDPEFYREQLEFYGLCAARAAGATTATLRIKVITDDGAVADGAEWSLDWEDLARIAQRTRETHMAVKYTRAARLEHERTAFAPWTPDVTEGPQCRYCPAFLACPAKRAAIAAVLSQEPLAWVGNNAGDAILRARDLETASKAARAALQELLANGESVSTSDGRPLRINGAGALVVGRAA